MKFEGYALLTQSLSEDKETWPELVPQTNVALSWATQHGTISCWSPEHPTRLVVPTKAKWIRLCASVSFLLAGKAKHSSFIQIWSSHNGQGSHLGYLSQTHPAAESFGSPTINVSGPYLEATPGDYYELICYRAGQGSVKTKPRLSTYFQMEVYS